MRPKFRVIGALSARDREILIRRFEPAHPLVYAHHVTLAYRPGPEQMPRIGAILRRPLRTVTVTGLHRETETDLLLLAVDGETHRPDGVPYHLTLSVERTREAADAIRRLDASNITWLPNGPSFNVRFDRVGLKVDVPTLNPYLAAAA